MGRKNKNVVVAEVANASEVASDVIDTSAEVANVEVAETGAREVEISAPRETGAVAQVGADALKGRVGRRTHAIHIVLIEAYKRGALLSTKQIVAGARELLGAQHDAYAKLDKTAPSHLNTMRGRQFIERVTLSDNGASVTGWRLTELGARLCALTQ